AAGVDRRAAFFHHACFDRRTAGPWLLDKRVKRRSRPRISARTAVGFLFSWARVRAGNLLFGLSRLPAWWRASSRTDSLAERVLATDLRRLSARRLRRLAGEALALHRSVRRVHAGLWYPIDLMKDLAAFEERFGPAGLSTSLPQPARRTSRDRMTAELVLTIRERYGGAHPPWVLDAASRAQIERHLVRFPYAFESRAEVQDPAAWRAWSEKPEAWWSQQSSCAREELALLAAAPQRSSPPRASLAGRLLRAVVGMFTPLKDDRVELLAKAGAVLRAVLLEVERRAGGSGPDAGWVFELEPAELERLAAVLERPAEVERLCQTAVRRLRERVLEGFAAHGQAERVPAPELVSAATGAQLELRGRALAPGFATGRAFPAATASEAQRLRPGEVLVVEELRPAFTGALLRACALVCQRGSPLSHGAIIARELGIPAVAVEDLAQIGLGAEIAVDGRRGVVGVLASTARA
ncbi:MAG: PEP-utilizing enzyme, partial [Myxococcales bacterium]